MTKTESLKEDLTKALKALKEALAEEPTVLNQDATIQRFEFTFELSWKLMQEVLRENRIDTYGVRGVFREAARLELVEDPLPWFSFLEARNLTAHTYNEEEARKIYTKIKDFPALVDSLLASTSLN